jgi:hypothetical protein
MFTILVVLAMLLGPAASAQAQLDINIEMPGISIGMNVPAYPHLVLVPGYPVYYAPSANSNYFFFDGVYWVYWEDTWYASSWYNGPWRRVGPEYVPLFVLRVPVRYYRRPPVYFRGWSANAPPRWGEHWGQSWEGRRHGWDEWDRHAMPAAAPLPVYQRQYTGKTYPKAVAQQDSIRTTNYRYQPGDMVTRQVMPAAQVHAPQAAAPQANAQQANAPQAKAPQANTRQADVPHAKTQPVQVQQVRQPQETNQAKPAPQPKPQPAKAQPPVPQGNGPQDRGQAKQAPQQPREQLVRPPQGNPPQDRGQAKQAPQPPREQLVRPQQGNPPQNRPAEPQAAPQNRGQENKGQEKQAPQPDKGREGKDDKRG